MRAIIALALFLFSASATAQNLSAASLRIVPSASFTCPTGRVCVFGTSASSPSRVAFADASGNQLVMGEAWYLRQSAGAPASPLNGWIWYDTTANAGYLRANGANVPITPVGDRSFFRACTLTSAAAATPITCLADSDVPTGQKVYLAGVRAKVNGATAWATVTACVVEDSSGVDLLTLPVAALTGNVLLSDTSVTITVNTPLALGSGGTASKGLRIVCDVNGAGSDLVVSTWGMIR